jgi:hypothetical protein
MGGVGISSFIAQHALPSFRPNRNEIPTIPCIDVNFNVLWNHVQTVIHKTDHRLMTRERKPSQIYLVGPIQTSKLRRFAPALE